MGSASFAGHPPCCVQDKGYLGVPPAGHALWAEVGGGITFVTSWGEYWAAQIHNAACHDIVWSFLGFFFTCGSHIC